MMGYWNNGYGFGGAEMFFGGLFMFLFWALIIWAIVAFVHGMTKQQGEGTAKHSAIHILEERYAKGEISKEEFEEKKSVLRK